MATYTNPGVYVSESTLVNNVQRANTAQSVAVFIGTAPRGPMTPTLINSWSGFKALYGDITLDNELGYSVYHYFANGGRDAYIIRTLHTSGTAPLARSASSYIQYFPAGSGSSVGASVMFTATAANPGAWGTGLTVTTSSSPAAPSNATSSYPTFNVSVKLNAVEVENWNEVSLNPANNRYLLDVVNTYSKYITVASPAGATVGWAIKEDVADIFTFNAYSTPFGSTTISASVATNGTDVDVADYQAAITKVDAIQGSLLLNAPGQTNSSVVTSLLNTAEARGDSFVIIDPAASGTTFNGVTGAIASYPKSSYGAVYYPQLVMADPTKTGPAAVRNTFPGGAVAGAYIRSEVARTVAKAPAGYDLDIRNALGLTGSFTESEAGSLYDTHNVNLFKTIPGAGIVINGARTMSKATPAKYIPIRRSLNYLKQALKAETAFAVFEPNDERLWTRINMNVSSLLSEFWRSGGLKGANANQAFYIVCNSTNNTSTTINNGEVHVEVGVALQYPAEFIVINLSQWTGGSNTVSTL
jgi:phage tail sheath protein FI